MKFALVQHNSLERATCVELGSDIVQVLNSNLPYDPKIFTPRLYKLSDREAATAESAMRAINKKGRKGFPIKIN